MLDSAGDKGEEEGWPRDKAWSAAMLRSLFCGRYCILDRVQSHTMPVISAGTRSPHKFIASRDRPAPILPLFFNWVGKYPEAATHRPPSTPEPFLINKHQNPARVVPRPALPFFYLLSKGRGNRRNKSGRTGSGCISVGMSNKSTALRLRLAAKRWRAIASKHYRNRFHSATSLFMSLIYYLLKR